MPNNGTETAPGCGKLRPVTAMIDESQHGARVDAWMDRTLEGYGPASCASSAAVWSTRSTMAASVTTNETADVARIMTGVRNLDERSLDGPPKGSGVIIGGPPGSGKTILTQQICFHTAPPEEPVLYFNTPMAAGSTVEHGQPDPATVIERAALRMKRRIQDLLEVTRMEAGHLSIERAIVFVKGFVEAHGGRIRVESTLGQGSTLSLTLPVAARAASRSATPQPVGPDERVR